jgi:hypothetical protein
VEEKLHVFTGKIQRVYRDEVCQGGKEALAYLRSLDRENYNIVKKLIERGASFEATEDAALLAESRSWLEMVEREPFDTIALELYQETLKERDRYISSRIDETLKGDELGVLFIEPNREVKLSESVKVIMVCRFDPSDYLRSWQVRLKSK